MNAGSVAIGVGAALGAAAGIGASIYGNRAEQHAAERADADWAATRPQRQPEIDRANSYVEAFAERFDQPSAVHDRNGLNAASLFDPSGEIADYLTAHRSEIPAHVSSSAGGYSTDYVKVQVTEPRRELVKTGATATAAAVLGGGAAMGAGALISKFTQGTPRAIGGLVAAAGAAAFITGLLGNVFTPESAIQW